MPTENMTMKLTHRFRSRNTAGAMKGRSEVAMCTTKRYRPSPASTASITTSRALNQSLVSPRSSMSCSAPMPMASTANPVQSNLISDFASAFGRKIAIPVTARMPNGRLT